MEKNTVSLPTTVIHLKNPLPKPVRYFVGGGSDVTGPFTLAQLQSLWRREQIDASVQICLEGSEEWKPVDELRPRLEFKPGVRHQSAAPAQRRRERRKRFKSKNISMVWLILLTVGIILALVTGITYLTSRYL